MQDLEINQEFKDLLPPLSEEEFDTLETSCLKEGIREPLIVWNGTIIDGHNRYKIAKEWGLNFDIQDIQFGSREEAKDWIDANQLGRRNLTLDQRKIIIGRRYNREKNNWGGDRKSKGQNGTLNPTANKVAEESKVSPRTVKRYAKDAEFFEELEAEKPETAKKVWDGQTSLTEAKREKKKEQRQKDIQQKAIELKDIPLPKRKYSVILADPPWRYEHIKTDNRKIENHYPTMDLEDICNLEIPADDDCVLYLWTTAPKLEEAIRVIKSWGFNYRTNAIWDKKKIGMGYWFRGQHELLLVCTKGKPRAPETDKRVSSVIQAEREKHSKKPIQVYKIIESAFPTHPKVELFARSNREGWDSWGNELEVNHA